MMFGTSSDIYAGGWTIDGSNRNYPLMMRIATVSGGPSALSPQWCRAA